MNRKNSMRLLNNIKISISGTDNIDLSVAVLLAQRKKREASLHL